MAAVFHSAQKNHSEIICKVPDQWRTDRLWKLNKKQLILQAGLGRGSYGDMLDKNNGLSLLYLLKEIWWD